MKKIQKQLAKEKVRNEEKKKEIDAKKIKKEERKAERERLIALGVISADSNVKTEPADEAAPMSVDDSNDEKDVKPKIKKEPESDDDDVDGVDMEDTQKLTSMRHQFIPGGLKEPEQREQVKIGLNFGGSKVVKRNNVKKAFTIKPKRKMFT
ncbi:unnamed protein product [Oikopleura dioica]|uniref:Uncharacterized protein n=1 Tax=Oikopleura dioica TaxID=34765 RepID=E4Y2N1_OIKDI|nr:unnamed protein product [Oikopleura dioica]